MNERPRNIFLLTADALRTDVFLEFSDELPDFVNGVTYTDAVATASATAHSLPALAAGVYMDRTGYGLPENKFTTLAEQLTDAGYSSGLWCDNHLFGPEYNYDRGFEGRIEKGKSWEKKMQLFVQKIPSKRFFNFAKQSYFKLIKPALDTLSTQNSYYQDAESVNSSILEWLHGSNDENHFVWAHYMDTHHPFEPPQEYLDQESFSQPRSRNELSQLSSDLIISNQGSAFTDDDLEDVRTVYRACCKYWVDQMAEFLQTLRDRGHFDPEQDLLVLSADHGEGFDPDRYQMVGHTPTPSFWEDVVRVPLIIHNPEWSPETINEQVSLIDLMPTLLDAASVSVPEHLDGEAAQDPRDLVREHTYFTAKGPRGYYHGIRGLKRKLFADRINTAEGSDQMNTRDGDVSRLLLTDRTGETETVLFTRDIDNKDSPAEYSATFDELQITFKSDHQPDFLTSADETLSEDVREHLESLGYLDDIPDS